MQYSPVFLLYTVIENAVESVFLAEFTCKGVRHEKEYFEFTVV